MNEEVIMLNESSLFGARSSSELDHNHRRKQQWSKTTTTTTTISKMNPQHCDPSKIQDESSVRSKLAARMVQQQVPKQVFLALILLASLLASNLIRAQEVVVVDDNATSKGRAHQHPQSGGRSKPAQLLASFSTPSHLVNITHVAYEPLQDIVYVGATNALYQLSGSDLSVMHEQTTGPVFDHPLCGITECRGFEEQMRPIANVNKVLLVDYKHRKLLACGSTKQGACRRYKLGDISQKEELTAIAVAANDDNSSTYAFIGPARYSDTSGGDGSSPAPSSNSVGQQQQQVLYVGATYTKAGQSRDLLVPSIGSRILDDGPNLLKLYENSFLDSARIDINSHLRDYFLVNYVYGFTSSSHVYFATVQKKATSRDYEELGYHTRLARVCLTDSSYNSYVEVDLKCGQDYPLLQDAILVDAGSHLVASIVRNSAPQLISAENKVLIGVFASARDHTHHAGDHSAVCAFSLSHIEDAFNDNIHACYTGKMQSRNMEYIAGNVQECPRGAGSGGNVVNFCHETLKINGTIPIQAEPAIAYANTTLTAITATASVQPAAASGPSHAPSQEDPFAARASSAMHAPHRQHTVVFAGTSSGHIKKILLNNVSNAIEFEDVQLDSQAILGDLHLHATSNQLIAATPYKILKTPVHDCAQYTNCRECSQARNPYCGWCALKKSCTTKTDCVGPQTQLQSDAATTQSPAQTAAKQPQPQAAHLAQQQQLKWISSVDQAQGSSYSASKCIELRAIVPEKVPMTSMGKIDLYIERLPKLPKEHSYRCVFERREHTSATQTPFGLSCPLPKVMHRPKIQPGRDHATVDLAVRSSETNTDFLDTKITFFECQLHTTCKDCLTTNWGCNWCLNENICLFNTSKCERTGSPAANRSLVQVSSGSRASSFTLTTLASNYGAGVAPAPSKNSNTIAQVNQCPTFDVGGHQKDIVVADGSERELSIRVKNMPSFKGAIQCIVEIENERKLLKARFDDDRVVCENSTYSYAADVGMLAGQLVAIYSENNILIDRTNFTLYKCHLLGSYLNRPDCSLCQRIDSNFQCQWCGGSSSGSGQCLHRSQCAALNEPAIQMCPAPRIDFVRPLAGPLLGGTRVSIEGSNLGQSYEEISNKVFIGNVPCKPVEEEYRPSNRIVCITSPIISTSAGAKGDLTMMMNTIAADIVVKNRAGNSTAPQKFLYKPVQLRDHQPRFGPQSGGTRLVLAGSNLNIGSSLQVMLDEIPCQVEPSSVSSEQVVCRTSAARQPNRAIKQLRLIIDNVQIVRQLDPMLANGLLLDSTLVSRSDFTDLATPVGPSSNSAFGGVFYYTPDPQVTRIAPLSAYLSGGRPINVYGNNLSSVQSPKLVIVDIATGRRVNETTCIVQDDQRMQCPAPVVAGEPLDETDSQRVAPSAEPADLKFRLSLVMDNVWRLRDLQVNQPNLASEIVYSNDPKLYPFNSPQYRHALQAYELEAASLTVSQAFQGAASAPGATSRQNYQLESDTYLLQPVEPILVLFGEHLRAAVSDYEITVTVGQDLCNLTQLSAQRIICSMPMDHMATPTNEDGQPTQRALPLVVIRIGFNLRQELGFVQYHPQLVEQIVVAQQQQQHQQSRFGSASQMTATDMQLAQQPYNMRAINAADYANYVPRIETDAASILNKVSAYISNLLFLFTYLTLAFLLLALIYSSVSGVRHKCRSALQLASKFKQSHCAASKKNPSTSKQLAAPASGFDYKRLRAKIDQLERALKNECQLGALALQGDLNELIRHVDLNGIPLVGFKRFVMRVFFPGIDNHPLWATSGQVFQRQCQTARPLPMRPAAAAADGFQPIQRPLQMASHQMEPMQQFEQLIMTKPFLVAFINTLERQPSFSIRDKVNVASLVMVALIGRLDYATDIMRTLLLQLIEKTLAANQTDAHLFDSSTTSSSVGSSSIECNYERANASTAAYHIGRRLTRRASNLLNGLHAPAADTQQVVGDKQTGSAANSLMASTGAVAQMLLSRVGAAKTTPFDSNGFAYHQSGDMNGFFASQQRQTSTTAFDRKGVTSSMFVETDLQRRAARATGASSGKSASMKLMLRRTDSVVEKMLSNWLALTMYDQFESGAAGRSLYLLFEALKCQLERGPIDAVSGDAFYGLTESRLLREPMLHFEVVSLYVIVDAAILSIKRRPIDENESEHEQSNSNNLLLDQSGTSVAVNNVIYESDVAQQQHYVTTNTLTLALRVLDCDTIDQVKSKILAALYRNSAYSQRVSVDQVELILRQQPSGYIQQQTANRTATARNNGQHVEVVLRNFEPQQLQPQRRLNTLRHYGVTDQAIMMLNRCTAALPVAARPTRDSMLIADTDQQTDQQLYNATMNGSNNPYADIQYGPLGNNRPFGADRSHQQQSAWHLTTAAINPQHSLHQAAPQRQVILDTGFCGTASSPNSSSHSPSMMLLSNESSSQIMQHPTSARCTARLYQGSSSSTTSGSSTGNVAMDTNSSATAMVASAHQQQPIYCQIGSVQSGDNQQGGYYCQIGNPTGNNTSDYRSMQTNVYSTATDQTIGRRNADGRSLREHEHTILLSRMLTCKGALQAHLDNFFKTILSVRAPTSAYTADRCTAQNRATGTLHKPQVYEQPDNSGAAFMGSSRTLDHRQGGRSHDNTSCCPPAVKWLFDLLDEAALKYNVADRDVVHSWKSNAFLLRFWVNFIKNPNYVLDVEKSTTIDASLSAVAQTLMESCNAPNRNTKASKDGNPLFAKDVPKYQTLVRHFYQDIASMQPVSDSEIAKRLGSLSMISSGRFDTNLALKELCVHAINYGGELINALNNDVECQQLDLANQMEQCFRSFTIFEAYR